MFRRFLIVGAVLAGCAALPLLADTGPPAEECAICHEEVVSGMAKTPHAVVPGWDAANACSNCHGNGQEHVDSGGEIDAIVRPQLLEPREASQQCLSCHSELQSHFRGASALHRLADVACQDCHNPHVTTAQMLVKPSEQLCGDCHQAQVAQFDLPRAHPIEQCSDCHNPHGSESLRMSVTLANETCGNCHTEKTTPYVYAHDVGMLDGCSSCHTVHGSTNRHLLTYDTQVNLCYQCHSGTSTPGFHSAQRFLGEKCTACHTAIHGSNTNPYFLEE